MWVKKLLRSFRYAFQGVARTMRAERNMRIHLTAVAYVTALGFLAELDAPRWAAILLCFGAVLAVELINTALESLCDAVCPEQNPKIGAAKDAAAGAVLVLSIVAVGVAIATFGPWLVGGGLVRVLRGNEILLPIFLISIIPAILFIGWPSRSNGGYKNE